MNSIISFFKKIKIPKKDEVLTLIKSLNKKQFILFLSALFVALVADIIMLSKINNKFMVEVPESGGSIVEGIVGIPVFINPVLAVSEADKDLTKLVYSGLMRKNGEGEFIPDLAESFEISPNKLTYTFILKDNIYFHDGKKLTTDDIEFTINKIKDPLIKSPYYGQWINVDISKQNEKTISFIIKQPSSSFLENTTIGIIPMHIWENLNNAEFVLSDLNNKGIGSGPYFIKSISKNKEGVPESYKLKRFKKFALGTPYIKEIQIISFSNENDLLKAISSKKISQAGNLSPQNAKSLEKNGLKIHKAILPRMFGLFFNSEENKIFSDKTIINAFNKAINKQKIIDEVLFGYGLEINNPISRNLSNYEKEVNKTSIEEANKILEKAGWLMAEDGFRYKGKTKTIVKTSIVNGKKVKTTQSVPDGTPTKLHFSLSTANDPELNSVVEIIKQDLKIIGVDIEIKSYDTGALNQLIRERKYESLFLGQVINNDSDLFAYWHSSQKKDPGLNIALYGNSKIDGIIESIQKGLTDKELEEKYHQFTNEFNKDLPAIFIYSPEYLYAVKSSVKSISFDIVKNSSDRFNSIYKWYINSNDVWKIFTK